MKPILLRRLPWLLVILALQTGCRSGGGTVAASPAPAAEEAQPMGPPAPFQSSPLLLLNNGTALRLGTSYEEALLVFARPKTAFDFSELPPRFKAPYKAQGWDTARTGFGVITYNSRMVLAISQAERSPLSEYDKLIKTYESVLPGITPTDVTNGNIRYRFYEASGERLMILAVPGLDKTVNITVALGLTDVMSAIAADPESAKKSVEAVEKEANH